MDEPSAPEVDPWLQKSLLAFEGGGTRGYASIRILQNLMTRIEMIEKMHPEPHNSSFGPPPDTGDELNGYIRRVRTNGNNDAVEAINPLLRRGSSGPPGLIRRATRVLTGESHHDRQQQDAEAGQRARQRLEQGKTDNVFLASHYFDYIAGTSTGALNALMFGRLRMTTEECTEHYPDFARRIFQDRRGKRTLGGILRPIYDHAPLEAALNDLVEYRLPQNAKKWMKELASPEDLCRVLVLSKQIHESGTSEERYVFRSFSQPHNEQLSNTGAASSYTVPEVGRAATAAPRLFKPMQLKENHFSDAGVGFNDPTEEAYEEILVKEGWAPRYHRLHHYQQQQHQPGLHAPAPQFPVSLVLTIGTGERHRRRQQVAHLAEPHHQRRQQSQQVGNNNNNNNDNNGATAPRRRRRRAVFDSLKLYAIVKRLTHAVTSTQVTERRMRGFAAAQGFMYYKATGGGELGARSGGGGSFLRRRRTGGLDDCRAVAFERMDRLVDAYVNEDAEVSAVLEQMAQRLVEIRRQRIRADPQRWQRWAYCVRFRCPYCLGDGESSDDAAAADRVAEEEAAGVVMSSGVGPAAAAAAADDDNAGEGPSSSNAPPQLRSEATSAGPSNFGAGQTVLPIQPTASRQQHSQHYPPDIGTRRELAQHMRECHKRRLLGESNEDPEWLQKFVESMPSLPPRIFRRGPF